MIRLSGVLFTVALVCALILALVNQQTAPVIAEQQQTLFDVSCREVLEAQRYVPVTERPNYFAAQTTDGAVVGWCARLSPKGYGGPIAVLAGIDTHGVITGVKIIEHNETPGLGSKITDPQWLAQFQGKHIARLTLVKTKTDSGIQAITGATISSKAVVDGISAQAQELNAWLVKE